MRDADRPGETSVSDAVEHYIVAQCTAVTTGDVRLREGADAVHDTRVAVRRLYSTLRVFTPIFDESAARSLAVELSWYAGLLGAVRDREVQRARMSAAVAALPDDLVLGPVAEHIDEHLRSELGFHRAELSQAMAGERYQDLLADLARWAGRPSFATNHVNARLLLGLAERAARKADKRLRRARRAEHRNGAEPPEILHDARKAAKRARYAAELVEPVDAKRAAARVQHFKEVQSILGDHQDSVVAAELLRLLGARAGTLPGHNGFTYGVLYEREVHAGAATRRAVGAL